MTSVTDLRKRTSGNEIASSFFWVQIRRKFSLQPSAVFSQRIERLREQTLHLRYRFNKEGKLSLPLCLQCADMSTIAI